MKFVYAWKPSNVQDLSSYIIKDHSFSEYFKNNQGFEYIIYIYIIYGHMYVSSNGCQSILFHADSWNDLSFNQ